MSTGDENRGWRPTRRRTLLGLGFLGGGLAAGSLVWQALTRSTPVVVGGSLPLSGSLSNIGSPLRRGLVLWAETATADGGLAGRDIEVDIADDEGDAALARQHYGDHATDWDLLAGPYGSPMTAAVLDIVDDAETPCIAHTAGDRGIWADGQAWTVQLLNPVDTFLHPVLDVASAAGALSVAFIHRSDPFTPATVEGAMAAARTAGWDVRDAVVYDAETDLEQTMDDVLAEGTDVVIGGGFQPGAAGGGFLPDAVALSRAYERAGGDADLACWSIGASFAAFHDDRGEAAAGEVGVTGWKPYVGYPGNGSFVDRYADRWGTPPDSHSAQGYATGQLYEAAVAAAGTVDPRPVREVLFDLETETVFGRYRVDDTGLQRAKQNVVVQWQRGEPVVVGPDRWRDGALVYPA